MIVTTTDILGLKKHVTGKVRDVYDLGDSLMIVASDRLSAFDVVLPTGIPDKGKVLTQLSLFWFGLMPEFENHLITADIDEIIDRMGRAGVFQPVGWKNLLEGRTMVVVKAKPCPIECIVRGYLAGSSRKEHQSESVQASIDASGMVYLPGLGLYLPASMEESEKLPTAVFTASTKETDGHDINIPYERVCEIVGDETAAGLRRISLGFYTQASEYAANQGVIIADTKFEIGEHDGRMILIDEVLTPDSSRFWNAKTYKPGGPQPSYDKQFVRDYLEMLDWDKTYPGPELPRKIVEKTAEKYREAYRLITGRELN